MQRQDLDLTIVTREPGNEIGQLLRKERLVWAAAPCFCAHEQTPCRWRCSTVIASAPVGLLRAGCHGRDYRLAYHSSRRGDQAVVSAGLAMTAHGKPDHGRHAHPRQ
jgi:hypothetical protein